MSLITKELNELVILLIIHHKLDGNTGAPGVTLALAKSMRSRGHIVNILSFDSFPGPITMTRVGFAFYVALWVAFHSTYDVIDATTGDSWVLGLMKRVGLLRPALIVRSHGLEQLLEAALFPKGSLARRKRSLKGRFYNGWLHLWECKASLRFCSAVLVLNDAEKDYATKVAGLPDECVYLVKNGISAKLATSARLALDQAPARSVRNIGFIGSHISRKGADVFCEAMRGLLSGGLDIEVWYLGSGVPESVIRNLYPVEHRSRVHVVPRFENAQFSTYVEPLEIVVSPSLFEGAALAPLEGMATGLVPIVSDIPGLTVFVEDNVNGIVLRENTADVVGEAVKALVLDEDRWHRLRTQALKTATTHSWGDIAYRTEEIYIQIIKRETRLYVRSPGIGAQ